MIATQGKSANLSLKSEKLALETSRRGMSLLFFFSFGGKSKPQYWWGN